MKMDGLEIAAVIGALALLIMVLGLAVFLGPDWNMDENHAVRWIARDFGTVIAAVAALTAAFFTIRKMHQQIEQTRTENDRIAACEYASEIRTDYQKLRVSLSQFLAGSIARIITYREIHENFVPTEGRKQAYLKRYPRAPEGESKEQMALRGCRIEEFVRKVERFSISASVPEIRTGVLPLTVRTHITLALLELQRQYAQVRDTEKLGLFLEYRFEETLQKWAQMEFEVVRALILLEVMARRYLEKETLYGKILPINYSVKKICADEQLHLSYPKVLAKLGIEKGWSQDELTFFNEIPIVDPAPTWNAAR